MIWKIMLTASFVALGLANQTFNRRQSDSYYPLALGDSWSYVIHENTGKRSSVIWKVTSEDKIKNGGSVFQVWPHPMQADDDALILASEGGEVREQRTHVVLVNNHIKAGDRWSVKVEGVDARQFKVLKADEPCQEPSYSSYYCATVEETDLRLNIRTITRYARGIGPIRFEYYNTKVSNSIRPMSVATLVDYHVTNQTAESSTPTPN